MLHLLDGFGPLLLGEKRIAPVFEEAVMQPILVDGTEFEIERFVKLLDDLFVAFQNPPSGCLHGIV
ncbi:hypothetical protein D3C71_1917040 [compost metagenome]